VSKNHQIWHGDSIELCKKFKAKSIACVITDPPFGSDNRSNMSVTPEGKDWARKIANDATPEEALEIFRQVMASLLPAMKDESDLYIFTAGQVLEEWLVETKRFLGEYGFTRRGILIWAKGTPGLGDLESWGQAIEYILYYKKGTRPRSAGITRANGFFQDPQIPPLKLIHPHEKPITLLRKFIEHSTDKDDWLVDPFGGSGSLVRAAEACGRNAVAIELDERNYKLAKDALDSSEGGGFF
jgi:adenine-specific DNA-methyltransferase